LGESLDRPVCVTYDLTRLQNLATPEPVLLTLNPNQGIDRNKTLQTFVFQHPVFSTASVGAQRRFSEISGQNRTHFCGAYWGHGFHEDGVRSALAVGQAFGRDWDQCTTASTKGSCDTGGIDP
jgi:predicted NAD/FAD-binding protein